MWLSKSNRIILLLIIDSAFFLLELSVGYAVHSLALVADSFHMLNDVLSLCVGLWAVKVAHQKTDSKMYTYGWQRAETLGALVNGVFLVALCLSIFLEAIQRLVEPQEVSNPKLVCIVGCFGLLSNILGLVLFHDHSHGGHGHSHGPSEPIVDAEEGRSYVGTEGTGVVVDGEATPKAGKGSRAFVKSDETGSTVAGQDAPASPSRANEAHRRRSASNSFSRGFGSVDDIYVHPANLRREIIAASRFEDDQTDSDVEQAVNGADQPSERSGLLANNNTTTYTTLQDDETPFANKKPDQGLHDNHNHAQPQPENEKGHSHGDLNMRGVFLHVLGDALGNIGVIASALIIWLSSSPWRYYADPGISLVITVIILWSAIPLCKAASRILLQAVPPGMSIDHIIEDIESLPGVVSCHHFHVWQLSDIKLVASLHIQVDCEIKGEGSERYMNLARQVRRCLHAYGIHSSTIQPEFYPESDVDENSATPSGPSKGNGSPSTNPSRAASVGGSEPATCLLECGEECAAGGQCCPAPKIIP